MADLPDSTRCELQVIDPLRLNVPSESKIFAQVRLMCDITPTATMQRLLLCTPRDVDIFDMAWIPCLFIEKTKDRLNVRFGAAQSEEASSLNHTAGRLNHGYLIIQYCVEGSAIGTGLGELRSLPSCHREDRDEYLQKSDEELQTIQHQQVEELVETLLAIVT